ncbi:uncharacterized protein LOC121397909 isoform X3 [Xenopus laevis]|uniref:Uncharacterized protein LOC121397909 isoform X3 n=1 Tax=Xenopus laevis TaxID=8355 RepID=A0A8J1LR79_XENLA|nr:uncharacterized protein LOC121397909 isoform X3 [Xenopus laevis]
MSKSKEAAASSIILKYLNDQNRPYSTQDVFSNLQRDHGLGKTESQPCFVYIPSVQAVLVPQEVDRVWALEVRGKQSLEDQQGMKVSAWLPSPDCPSWSQTYPPIVH